MSIVKALRFPVQVQWEGGRLTVARAPGRDVLRVVTPPEFRGGIEGEWSPEDLLVAATASCFILTLTAIAERHEVMFEDVRVSGTGHISRRDDGRYGFVAIELDAEIFAPAGAQRTVKLVAEEAEQKCIVSMALDIPVHVAVIVRPPEQVAHFLGTGVPS
jgi:organic hydroperoxide reductase OsmC/OhrA